MRYKKDKQYQICHQQIRSRERLSGIFVADGKTERKRQKNKKHMPCGFMHTTLCTVYIPARNICSYSYNMRNVLCINAKKLLF